jgi:hypothetical protein
MRTGTFCAWAVLFALLGTSSAHAQGWISFRFGGGFSDAQAKTLADWINDTCRPDEMGNIIGFSYQNAPGAPINLQVYCRQAGTGKLGKIKVLRREYSEFHIQFELLKSMQRAAILGFDLAKAASVTEAPTGTVVMVVRE